MLLFARPDGHGHFVDGELANTPDVRKTIVKIIRQLKPDIVITMDPTLVYSVETGYINHPDHKVAMKQMKHGGGMLSYEMKDGLKAGIGFMNKLKMCVRTVSLGTAESILCHPASMTHAGTPKESREKYGITDGLIRMSVGLENVEDILNDLEQALK